MERPSPPTSETPGDRLPRGLVFFPPGTSRRHRRRRRAFVAVYVVAVSLVLWPVYPLFAGIRPLILGLPLSMAWVVGALLLVLAALVWLERGEDDPRSAEEPG